MRKIFTVYIHDKPYGVWDIKDREHEGLNGEPRTWWLYYSGELPADLLPPADSEYFIPYSDSIGRLAWDIRFKQGTSSKKKWGETRFHKYTTVEMWCNGKLVYGFSCYGGDKGLSFAMSKAQYMQTMLSEHPYDFFEPEKEHGRKVYWHGLPATLSVNKSETWRIGVVPDYSVVHKDAWWAELVSRESKYMSTEKDDDWDEIEAEDTKDAYRDDYINWGDAFSAHQIDWFRK